MSSPCEPANLDYIDVPTAAWDGYCACELVNQGHYPRTYAQIQSAARDSCRVCDTFDKVIVAVVDGCLPEVFQGPRDEAERAKILDDLVLKDASYRIDFKKRRFEMIMSIMGRWVTIDLFRDADKYPEEVRIGGRAICPAGRTLSGPTTASEQGFERARGWLRQCLEEHDCATKARGSDVNRQPKRLLDLRGDRIRLFETDKSEGPFDEPYVCLSHRWGDAQHRRLTSTVNTIQQHLQGILWDDLPRTFQDAVTVCRRFSVEYLWIDSLCILQEYNGMTDDEAKQTMADFVQENSMMATIYRNSYFTISADMSTNMNSGIFCARSYESHRIQAIDNDGNAVSIHIRQPTFHLTTTDLETRAWTLQEYVLPARVLSFGAFDISWRCQQRYTCECTESIHPDDDHWRHTLGTSCRPYAPNFGFVQTWWERMIYFYSNRKLTNEQDKLPGLSGLAQIYNETTLVNDTYLAGLWQTFLHRGLSWYHVLQKPGSYVVLGKVPYPMGVGVGRRPRGFRAPSWSWASLDACDDTFCCPWWPEAKGIGAADYQFLRQLKVCKIYEAVCKPKTKDAFGEVEPGAFISIGTKLIAATIAVAPDIDAESGLGKSGQRPVRGILPWTLSLTEDDREIIICFPDCRLGDDGLEFGDSVYCAPILEDLTEVESQIGCLVLRAVRRHQYRRVGYCVLGKKNPQFAQYTRKELDDLEGNWDARNVNLDEAEKEGRIIDYSLHYSQDPETRITIL